MTLRYKNLDFLGICSPQVREMYEHWAALRGERILPHRDDLDPARITRYLPGIMLVDVLWGPPLDFVCEEDVRSAMHGNLKITVGKKTIITPSARDLGEANDVFILTES